MGFALEFEPKISMRLRLVWDLEMPSYLPQIYLISHTGNVCGTLPLNATDLEGVLLQTGSDVYKFEDIGIFLGSSQYCIKETKIKSRRKSAC